MALLILLETTTTACSVALSRDGKRLASRETNNGYSHAENLAPFVRDVLAEAWQTVADLDAVSVSKGPGSYTGLRIGVSTAKGIAYGSNIPLIAVDTLESMALAATANHEAIEADHLLCPMLDARRMEVYAALFDASGKRLRETGADVVDENTYRDFLDQGPTWFFGPGAAKCAALLDQHPNYRFLPDRFPDATDQIPLAEKAFAEKQFEDVAYFEPFYLKDFVAIKPKKLL